VSFAYDQDGLLTQAGGLTIARRADNGLISGSELGSTSTTQTYNGFGELASVQADAGGTPVYSATYSRDKLGRITARSETIQGATTVRTYGYDLAGRLQDVSVNGEPSARYEYDDNGNRTRVVGFGAIPSVDASYDAQDRLTRFGGATYSYTANGELSSRNVGAETTRYDYDVLGNLRQVTLPDRTTIEYLIDGSNRRIGKKVNGVLVQGFVYESQLRPAAELDGAGNVVARFVYGTRPNVPEYMVKGGETYRFIHDHLGSPRLVVNVANGEVRQAMNYDESGKLLQDTQPGFQPFGFAGGLYDHDTGLVRFGTRDYEPEPGRWTSKDIALFSSGGTDHYEYAASDPMNAYDFSGFQARLNLAPPGSANEWLGKEMPSVAGVFTVSAHSISMPTDYYLPIALLDERTTSSGSPLGPFTLVKSIPSADFKEIYINACYAAEGGTSSYASLVSLLSGLPVVANTGRVESGKRVAPGEYFTSYYDTGLGFWIRFINGQGHSINKPYSFN